MIRSDKDIFAPLIKLKETSQYQQRPSTGNVIDITPPVVNGNTESTSSKVLISNHIIWFKIKKYVKYDSKYSSYYFNDSNM